MTTTKKKNQPIINAHTHVFTSAHVPPLLAKKFIPFPLYYLVHTKFIIRIYRFIRLIKSITYEKWYQKNQRFWNILSAKISRNPLTKLLSWIIGLWLFLVSFYFLFDSILMLFKVTLDEDNLYVKLIASVRDLALQYNILPVGFSTVWKIIIVAFFILFFKSGRNLILYVFKKIFSFLKILPGKQTQELIKRYLLIVKYSVYKNQTDVFSKMKDQYPKGTGFVLLPMDMKYMGAGKPDVCYEDQLADLLKIKTSSTYKKQNVKVYPFVFVDPRRIIEDRNSKKKKFKQLFNYSHNNGKVTLKESLIKTYIEKHKFCGFKIYPALGYYPFDKELLALWKYAADREIPITAHSTVGPIFYRGNMNKMAIEHQVFKDEDATKQLLFKQRKNIDFQLNFTHPMNYLCLLEEPLLRVLIEQYNDTDLYEIFGYTDTKTPLKSNLNKLKICFAHYAGAEQWERYLAKDSYTYSQQVIKNPGTGIVFIKPDKEGNKIDYERLAKMWKYVDWYSIISSMMMQYPNVYADISYILHKDTIFPLLKETLKPVYKQLPKRVLFGTDFYVVRNHDSEKGLYTTSKAHFTQEEFDLIAKENPEKFLKRVQIRSAK